jgi:hypothetical protein
LSFVFDIVGEHKRTRSLHVNSMFVVYLNESIGHELVYLDNGFTMVSMDTSLDIASRWYRE